MATAERGMQQKADEHKRKWEQSEFPILCETCLGDNPYVRMIKQPNGKACKICERPFTVFKWKPGRNARYKTTQVCQLCAKLKNACQTCILDLQYGLPVQVRDQFLSKHETVHVPKSDINREYFANNALAKLNEEGDEPEESMLPYGKATHEGLMRLARKTPYYKRNEAHICSFFVKGECNRGESCPYRHEMPLNPKGPLARQNIKDRYYGTNDPVAEKMLGRSKEMREMRMTPPEDKSVKSLFVGGLDESITEAALRDAFYSFGEILSVKIIPRSRCAFVEFMDRKNAEVSCSALNGNLMIGDIRMMVSWAKPKKTHTEKTDSITEENSTEIISTEAVKSIPPPSAVIGGTKRKFPPPPPSGAPPAAMKKARIVAMKFPPPPPTPVSFTNDTNSTDTSKPVYPSQDPLSMGSRVSKT